jgi:hypothetical protein
MNIRYILLALSFYFNPVLSQNDIAQDELGEPLTFIYLTCDREKSDVKLDTLYEVFTNKNAETRIWPSPVSDQYALTESREAVVIELFADKDEPFRTFILTLKDVFAKEFVNSDGDFEYSAPLTKGSIFLRIGNFKKKAVVRLIHVKFRKNGVEKSFKFQI